MSELIVNVSSTYLKYALFTGFGLATGYLLCRLTYCNSLDAGKGKG